MITNRDNLPPQVALEQRVWFELAWTIKSLALLPQRKQWHAALSDTATISISLADVNEGPAAKTRFHRYEAGGAGHGCSACQTSASQPMDCSGCGLKQMTRP